MISVNQVSIDEQQVLSEMQYHPAENQREAMLKAAESLIISELFRQRAEQLEIAAEGGDDAFVDQLIAREVSLPEATQTDCEVYYAANRDRFTTSPLAEVKHILLAVAPDDEAGRVETKTRAEALLEMLKQGADFGVLAKRESACPSKTVGGSLGQISKGQTVPEFERQVFLAAPGLMPRPIETRYGFHLVFLERKVPGKALPFDAVHAKIADYLAERVRRKAIAQYIEVLIGEAEIQGFDFDVSGSPLMQ